MPHFSRLTDIVTCNLTEILKTADDPSQTLREIITEIAEGLAACRRTVLTSDRNHKRLSDEIAESKQQIAEWVDRARQALAAGVESDARAALTRKVELEGLNAGLQPEMEAAKATCQHMLRIQKALEARHSDASRRLLQLIGGSADEPHESGASVQLAAQSAHDQQSEVDAELAALRKQLEQ